MVLVASDQPSKVLKPTDRPLDFPAATVAAERTPILRGRLGAVFAMWTDQLDATTVKPFAQRIAIGRRVVDQSPRLASKNSVFEQRLNESYFMGTRASCVDTEWETMAVGEDHNLRALTTFCLADLFTPFFADENVPSAKDSSRSTRPSRSSCRTNRAQTFSQTPDRVQSRWRRQQVVAEGKREGISFQRAPLRRIQRIPSTQRRDATAGRPPLGPAGVSGNRSLINCHCSSVSSSSGSIMDPAGGSTAVRERFFMSASFRLHSIRLHQQYRLASNPKF